MIKFRSITGLIAILFLVSACTLTVTTDIESGETDTEAPAEEIVNEGAPVEGGEESSAPAEEPVSEEPAPEEPPLEEPVPEEPAPEEPAPEEPASEPAVETTEEPAARVIRVEASSWQFSPSTIIASVGENVTIQIVGIDGIHGFAVPSLGINVSVAAGETVNVTLPTDTAGSYSLLCNIPCGSGHSSMNGTIVIQ